MKKVILLSAAFSLILLQTLAQSAYFTSDSPRCVNDTMHFTPEPPGGTILQEVWDFGDGVINTYLPPTIFPVFATHLYASTGTYAVTRTVKFNNATLSYNTQVSVIPRPISYFSWSNVTCVMQPVQFYDLSSTSWGTIQSWSWNFSDPISGVNNTSALPNPTHIFAAGGIYPVNLTVTSSNGCSDSYTGLITINMLPVANFAYTESCEGTATLFTDLSVPNAGAIISYNWDFGDGGSSTLASPMHVYAAYGTYNATLTVVNSNGCTHSITKPVVVYSKPVPAFTFPATNCMGSPVTFTDQSYIILGFPSFITTWAWDFGDGTPQLLIYFPANPNVMHIFAGTANAHVVRLTVTTSNGCTSYIEKIVNSVPCPVANFTPSGSICVFQPVQFFDLSQTNGGGSIQSWSWNFGDPASGVNNTSVAQNPTHIYSSAGTFLVTLGIVNSNGCTDTISKFLAVNSLPVANFSFDTVYQGTPTNFTDQSYSAPGTIVSRLWDFGDGQTSTAANPAHLYGTYGMFLAKLTVTNNQGCVKDTTKPVLVLDPLIGPPPIRNVTNVIVGNGQTKCYNASQLITIAGNGTLFFVLNGGNATFIAGQNIIFLPTSTIQSGGYMRGYIAPTGPFCVTPSMPAVIAAQDDMPGSLGHSSFRIYPNPTTGSFTLEFKGEVPVEKINVEIFGILGEQVLTEVLNGECRHEFSLSDRPAGLYYIRATIGDKSETAKVIKH